MKKNFNLKPSQEYCIDIKHINILLKTKEF